jgi:hypothetical protein
MGKSWKQKLDSGRPAHVEVLAKPFGGAPEGAKMLVATPRLVDQYIRNIPPGESRTVPQMRADLAAAHGAELACPLSTSIFARIAAEAAIEDAQALKSLDRITPFWRLIDEDSKIAGKLSCGREFIRAQRARELAEAPGLA